MADNIIQRIIKMVLDKESAKKTQEDANQMASSIDSTWKSVATKIGGYLAAGFLISKVVAFGKASVAEAISAEKAWRSLKNTVDNTGASYDAMQERITAAANAFQDATVHDDDAFAATLDRVVTLTGDAEASLNNMGLVANVAAKFFKGELEPAANLVAKAMNGNTNALRKMGIQAKDAQQALDILAQRSMGAATQEAMSYEGQLKQLGETYNDLLKEVGNAIIANDGATNGLNVLKSALQAATKWVSENKEEIQLWVTNGIKFAIDALDVLTRAILGMGNIIAGGFAASIGMAARIVGNLVLVLVSLEEFENRVRKKLGEDTTERDKNTAAVRKNMEALAKWGQEAHDRAKDRVELGFKILATPMFSSEDFTGKLKIPDLKVNKPMTGKNQVTEGSKEVTKALEDFQKETQAAANMQKVLGDQFDATGAEISRTTKLLDTLAKNGIDPASVGMAGLSTRLQDLVKNLKPVQDALKVFHDEERVAENQHRVLGERFDATGAEIDRTTKLLNVLAQNGIDPTTIGLGDLSGRLTELVTKIKPTEDATKSLAKSMRTELAVSTLEMSAAVRGLKKQQDDIVDSIARLAKADVSPHAGQILLLTEKYHDLEKAIDIVSKRNTSTLDDLKRQQAEIQTTIKGLTSSGVSADSERIKDLKKQYDALGQSIQNVTAENTASVGQLRQQQTEALASIQQLTADGVTPQEKKIGDLTKQYDGLSKTIRSITAESTVNRLKQQQGDILATIKMLLDEGLDPTSQAITDLTERYDALTDSIGDAEKIQAVADAYKNLGDEIRMAAFTAALEGADSMDAMKSEQQALLKAIQDLISKGIKMEDKALQDLIRRYKEVSKAIEEQTHVMELQTAVADVLAEALGAALQGGLHEAAVAKAKQNAIEAAEMLVRAGAFALMGRYDKAAQAVALAGEFAAVAAMWGAFAALSGGGGGGDAGGAGGGASAGGGSGLGESRAASNDSSTRAEQPQNEVTINLIGPGFHALNPAVQEVVWGATQQAEERFGPNARIRVRTSPSQ